MFIKINSIVLMFLLFIAERSEAQCALTWFPVPPDPTATQSIIGYPKWEQYPPANFPAQPNDIINLNLRFSDLDLVNSPCSSGLKFAGLPAGTYNITFNINNGAWASFDGLNSGITKKQVSSKVIITSNVLANPNILSYALYGNQNVKLFINPAWAPASGNIIVTANVEDITPLPPGSLGNRVDNPRMATWTIDYNAHACPTSMARVTTTPADDLWVDIQGAHNYTCPGTPPAYDVVPFCYNVTPNTPASDFPGVIVSEFLGIPIGAGVFTLSDLQSFWRSTNNIYSADAAAALLFETGLENSFIVSASDNIEDSHSANGLNDFSFWLSQAFTLEALNGNRVGFNLTQNFKSCGNNIGQTIIQRRLFPDKGKTLPKLRKKHFF